MFGNDRGVNGGFERCLVMTHRAVFGIDQEVGGRAQRYLGKTEGWVGRARCMFMHPSVSEYFFFAQDIESGQVHSCHKFR